MTPKVVRWVAMAVCLGVGIPGMIVSSITDHDGAAVTFGLVAVAASLCLITASTLTRDGAARPTAAFDDRQAAEVEQRVEQLVEAGAPEESVRDLVRASVRLGRSASEG